MTFLTSRLIFFRSRSRLDDLDDDGGGGNPHDLMEDDHGAFVNHAMDMDHRTSHQQGGHLGKATSQLSVASRAYLQNGGVSYRHEAPMLNDKYFPKDAYGGSNAYLGQTNVSIVPNGGMIRNGEGEYDGFKYPHLQLRNVSYDVKSKGNKYQRILDGITMETRGGDLTAIMATKRKVFQKTYVFALTGIFSSKIQDFLKHFYNSHDMRDA